MSTNCSVCHSGTKAGALISLIYLHQNLILIFRVQDPFHCTSFHLSLAVCSRSEISKDQSTLTGIWIDNCDIYFLDWLSLLCLLSFLSFTSISNKQPANDLRVVRWPVLVPLVLGNCCFLNFLNFLLICQSYYTMTLPLYLAVWSSLKSLVYINNSCLFLLSQFYLSPCFNIH